MAIYGIAIIVFALSQSFVLSMALLAVLGGADMVSVVIRMTLIQLETTDDMRGRVSAVNSLFVIASNQLGDFRAGLMAAWLGTIPAVLVGGVGALLVVLVGPKVFSALYRVETLETAALSMPAVGPRAHRPAPADLSQWSMNRRARPGRRGRASAGLRNGRRAAWRSAAPCAHGRAWSSGTWWRG